MADLFSIEPKPDKLYDEQQLVMQNLDARIAGGARRIVLQSPTGSGKTLLGSAIIQAVVRRQQRALWIVPAIALVDQTIGVFNRQGIHDIGVLQADHRLTNWDMPVQVASVQTLMRRPCPPASMIVIDECHKWFSYYANMMLGEQWARIPVIGLSATPWTKGLGRYYTDGLIIAGTTEDLINRGRLSNFKVYAPTTPDLAGVRTTGGDYAESDLSRVMNDKLLVADIVDTWHRLGWGRPTLCFGVDRSHARAIQQQFLERGVACGYQDAFTSDGERATIERQFRDGRLRVVCNVGTLTTGVDWDVRCIILARPTKSEILFTQVIGRGLRTADGKDHCLILDHSSSHERLGFVTDIHHTTLDDGRERLSSKRDPLRLPKVCPQCKFVRAPNISVCPSCGFKAVPLPIVNKAGELQELRRVKAWAADRSTIAGGLKSMEIRRGYLPGWARAKYQVLYGEPPDLGLVKVCEPSTELVRWIVSQDIRWAKSKKHLRNTNKQAPTIAPGSTHGGSAAAGE